MAWSYSAPNRNTGWSDATTTIIWDNQWTVTEQTPDRVGYIKLRLTVQTTHFEYYQNGIPQGSYDGSEDSCSYGGDTVIIRARSIINNAYNYTQDFYIPASWAGQTIRFVVAWRTVDVLCEASAAQPSTVSAADGVFGEGIAINISRQQAGVTHTLTVTCLGQTETLLTDSAEIFATWTPALATYGPLLTNGQSTTASIICQSHFEGSVLGSDSTSITVRFSAQTAGPTGVSGWAVAAPYNTGTAAAGMSCYVAGYSKAQISFDPAKITARCGATITEYSVTALGETDSSSPYLSPVLSGETAILCRATDSRGFTLEATLTVTPEPCAPPGLSAVDVFRCDGLGQADEDGAYVSVSATAVYSSLNGENTAAMVVSTRQRGGSWGGASSLNSGTALILSGFDPDLSYEVRIQITDGLGQSEETTRTLATRAWAMKFRPDGQGVGFGKAPESANTLELGNGWSLTLHDANGNAATLDYAKLVQLLATL